MKNLLVLNLKKQLLKQEAKRIIIFGCVGIGATVVHLLIAGIAFAFKLPPVIASFIGFLPAVLFSYLGHRYLTYADAEKASIKRFLGVAVSGFLFSLLVLLQIKADMPRFGLFLSIGVIPAWSYIMTRFWVFRFRKHRFK